MQRLARDRLGIAATLAFALLLTAGLSVVPLVDRARCELRIASSDEKTAMLMQFEAQYNAAQHEVGGCLTSVDVFEKDSGVAERALEQGWAGQSEARPDVWSPASSAWILLLAQRSQLGASLIPLSPPSLFESPLVIGMPKAMADALQYPARSVGWSDIFHLVNDPEGWGAEGAAYKTWGAFRLGKTDPTVSTSGINALIATYYASGAEATVQGVQSAGASEFVGGIEKGVAHYGRTARQFLSNLQSSLQGPPPYYVSAIAVEEQELVQFNKSSASLLVPIYPNDGTLVDDHPYVLLNWSKAKLAEANDFYNFVENHEREAIDENGFRDQHDIVGADLAQRLQETGVDPNHVLKISMPPSGQVLNTMINEWKRLRNSVRVLILIDTAVNAKALNSEICDLRKTVTGFEPQDLVGVGTFPTSAGGYVTVLPPEPASENGKAPSCGSGGVSSVDKALASIHAQGVSTVGSLPTAVGAALDNMSQSGNTPAPIVAVLLVEMSHGVELPVDDEIERKMRRPNQSVRIFTVGPAADPRLAALAAAGRGRAYSPGRTSNFLEDLISNF